MRLRSRMCPSTGTWRLPFFSIKTAFYIVGTLTCFSLVHYALLDTAAPVPGHSGWNSYVESPWNRELHCRRDAIGKPPPARPKVLFTGAGYSGSGFLSQLFGKAGYLIGHECMGRLGTSDWRRAFDPPGDFQIFTDVFLQVRHPLAIVRSWQKTRWNFTIPSEHWTCMANTTLYWHWTPPGTVLNATSNTTVGELDLKTLLPVHLREFWPLIPGEVKALYWWVKATSKASTWATCWWRVEDFTEHTARAVCAKSGFVGCDDVPWAKHIASERGYNAHANSSATLPQWDALCNDGPGQSLHLHAHAFRHSTCAAARELCAHFRYTNC
jgi:hypothetical protein